MWTEREGCLVRLTAGDGRVGWGEAAPLEAFGAGTLVEVERGLAMLGDRLERPDAWRDHPEPVGPLAFALATAERGLDAAPAGLRAEDPARRYWPVAGLLPAGRAALTAVRPQLEAGFRTFKWKVGVGDRADELTLLDDLLAELPGGARLRLDANGAWDRRQAEAWLERCAERPIEFVEQPIAPGARGADDLLRGLANDYPTLLALDESLAGPGDLRRWRDAGWRGVWVVKLALCGDPGHTLALLRAAEADVVFSSALETAVGAAAGLRAAFEWPGQRRALGYGVWPLFADARFDGPRRAPFVRLEDVTADAAGLWNALS